MNTINVNSCGPPGNWWIKIGNQINVHYKTQLDCAHIYFNKQQNKLKKNKQNIHQQNNNGNNGNEENLRMCGHVQHTLIIKNSLIAFL